MCFTVTRSYAADIIKENEFWVVNYGEAPPNGNSIRYLFYRFNGLTDLGILYLSAMNSTFSDIAVEWKWELKNACTLNLSTKELISTYKT